MPFVYSIIWFINGSGSIIHTIKNLFLITYSGKITLLNSIFIFYTQKLRHPGILTNSLEPLGYFLRYPATPSDTPFLFMWKSSDNEQVQLPYNYAFLRRGEVYQPEYIIREENSISLEFASIHLIEKGLNRIICHIRITIAKIHQPDKMCTRSIVQE